MPLNKDQQRLLNIVTNYPRALKMLAMRVRALEMMLKDKEPNHYHRYLAHLKSLEDQKHLASDALAQSELDQLLELLREDEKKKKS